MHILMSQYIQIYTFSNPSNGKASVGVPKCPFWTQCYAKNFRENNEDISKKVEAKRSTSIHLFGRHTVGGPHPNLTSKTFEHGGGRFDGSRIQIESQKSNLLPS